MNHPENINYGCTDCGSINHTAGDKNWCLVAQERQERDVTIPDELVQAAAEAICPHRVMNMGEACLLCRHLAKDALQAAFAKLPECEAAYRAVAEALFAWTGDPTDADGVPGLLTALAREFGGQE